MIAICWYARRARCAGHPSTATGVGDGGSKITSGSQMQWYGSVISGTRIHSRDPVPGTRRARRGREVLRPRSRILCSTARHPSLLRPSCDSLVGWVGVPGRVADLQVAGCARRDQEAVVVAGRGAAAGVVHVGGYARTPVEL